MILPYLPPFLPLPLLFLSFKELLQWVRLLLREPFPLLSFLAQDTGRRKRKLEAMVSFILPYSLTTPTLISGPLTCLLLNYVNIKNKI